MLPIVSFSADGSITIIFFIHSIFNHITGRKKVEPEEIAKARAIDLSIQFVLFWMPFLVLLGWWLNKPMHLLFGRSRQSVGLLRRYLTSTICFSDFFEVALLLGACFLVNYVTADAKTNWVEVREILHHIWVRALY